MQTMAGASDEGLFEYLHLELVSLLLSEPVSNGESKATDDGGAGDVKPEPRLTTSAMEYIGFSTGYRIVERLVQQ
jgi:hypothetical protein